MNKHLVILLFLVGINTYGQKENIIENNKELINALSKFDLIYEVDDNYIMFKTKKVGLYTNFGFGVAFRENGKVIYPAKKETSYFIRGHQKYIVISQGKNLSKTQYGLIDNSGKQILDFKYDKIGNVFVPLPDSIITVQKGNKFGVFNLISGELSTLKYDNSGNWINDGYSYHEGGAYEADQAIYKQLGIENFKEKVIFKNRLTDTIRIKKNEKNQWLTNNNNIKISKKYHYLTRLNVLKKASFFIGVYQLTPYKCVLIDGRGNEITDIYSYLPDHNDDYIKIDEQHYYFITTQRIVEIPKNYDTYVTCYAGEGFLGFREYTTNEKLFVDKNGNFRTINP